MPTAIHKAALDLDGRFDSRMVTAVASSTEPSFEASDPGVRQGHPVRRALWQRRPGQPQGASGSLWGAA